LSGYALKKYGYGSGDEYRFVMEMSTTSNTEEGRTSSSYSYEIILKIKDVDEDVGGYSIKIDVLVVGSTGYYPGFYEFGSLMDETSIEGDKLMAEGGGIMGSYFNLFTSTDWDERGDEWEDFVEDIDGQEGHKVDYESASNGVFALSGEMDISEEESYMDYDGDGDDDDYTGWFSVRGEYDSKGALESSKVEYYMEFNTRNSVTHSIKTYRKGLSLLPNDMLNLIVIAAASFVIALITGFFLGKRRKPKATETSTALHTEPEVPTKKCVECGAEISQDATFCIECGKKQK